MRSVKTIDAEVSGEAVRLIVAGGPSPAGATMAEKLSWMKRHADRLRCALMHEPRGHEAMHGALLTEPGSSGAHAGLLSMNAAGFPLVSGEGVIAAVTLALENDLLQATASELLIDTPAGILRARPVRQGDRVTSVLLSGLPSYVDAAGVPVQISSRKFTVDVASAGERYAIADSEAIGIPVEMEYDAELIRMGRRIQSELSVPIDGTIFTGAPRGQSDLRSATVLNGRVLRRSPGVTGTAAMLAVLDAMGLVQDDSFDHQFVHEGILGTMMKARVAGRRQTGERPELIAVVEGSASTTGFHEFRM